MFNWLSSMARARLGALAATAEPDHQTNAERLETDLKQYEVLALIIINIFNEFWQTNAFFTSFGTLVVAYSVTNWKTVESFPLFWHIAIFVLYEIFMAMWAVTTARHSQLITLHIQHAREIERRVGGLQIYERRSAFKTRLPSVRKMWHIAPAVFSVLPAIGVIASIVKAA